VETSPGFCSSLEYGVFALFDKNPDADTNVSRVELLFFPPGGKGHKVFGAPKAAPWRMPGTTTPLWKDQWGYGIARLLIQLFTRPGETVGDFFCGTATGSVCAINMGRNAVAVDRNADAIIHANTRLAELKEKVESTELAAWATAQNPLSLISLIPDWSRCDWAAIARREKRLQARIKMKKEEEKKQKRLDLVATKKKKEQKKADTLAAKKVEEAKQAEAAAKVLAESIAISNNNRDDDNDEEEKEEVEEEADEDTEPPIDIGTMTPAKAPLAVDPDVADDVPADDQPDTPGASPSVTRSKAVDDATK
jgi:hypothetical protein